MNEPHSQVQQLKRLAVANLVFLTFIAATIFFISIKVATEKYHKEYYSNSFKNNKQQQSQQLISTWNEFEKINK